MRDEDNYEVELLRDVQEYDCGITPGREKLKPAVRAHRWPRMNREFEVSLGNIVLVMSKQLWLTKILSRAPLLCSFRITRCL